MTTTPKTRLIFFSFGILEQGGGFEYYLMETARNLHERFPDLDIRVVTMDPKTVEKLQNFLSIYFMRKQDPKAIYRESAQQVRSMLGSVPYVRATSLKELAHILKTADVIYSKNEILELSVLNRIGLKKLPPVMLGVHTPIYYPHTPSLSAKLHNLLYTGLAYRYLTRRVRSILTNNTDDLQLVRTKLHFPNAKVARQAFEVPALRETHHDHDEFRLLFVGRLTEAKGLDLLIDTLRGLEQSNRKFVVKIAGSGDVAFVDTVKRLAQEKPFVEYLGHVGNSKVHKLYQWADAAIIPSKYETLNKVAVETAIAGKIAICTDIPGPREVVQHGVTGFLLAPDAQAFVHCINELAELKNTSPEAYKQLGRAAHAHVKAKFNPQNVYNELHKDITNTAKGMSLEGKNL